MGCAVSGVSRTMSLFSKRSHSSQDYKANLERKLYIAKESPEPEFDISNCELRFLPAGIFSICKVFRKDFLYLQNNHLCSLEEGGQLSDLYLVKVMNISNNQFVQLPQNIRYLINLTELYLQNNFLKTLPEAIGHLKSLQVLDVSYNKLKSLNPVIGKLKCLTRINIIGNENLHELCPELCFATNLTSIELNGEQFIFPSSEIATKETADIMRFLCSHMKIKYIPPMTSASDASMPQTSSAKQNYFVKQLSFTWEEQEATIKEQESKIRLANQNQREKFLTKVLHDQQELDKEIAKAQEMRDVERQRLLKCIQEDEQIIQCLLNNFTATDKLNPEIIQQQLAYEQAEHEHLLEITKKNYDNVRKADILKATEQLLEKDCLIQYYKNNYLDSLNNIKKDILEKESEVTMKLAETLNVRDENRTAMVKNLLEDQDVQKAIVSSLLDRIDAKSWSLNQEISLISHHLARLSVIEQEKKRIHIVYNYNELLQQRIQLVNLLDDLLNQRSKRKKQLIDTLKEAEDNTNIKTDFWLRSYQKLLDAAPKTLFDVGKLDPLFANYLLQEGVIHCLPFLVKFLFSGQSLLNLTHNDLKENGVTLTDDRNGIMKAINLYVAQKSVNREDNHTLIAPTAPPLPDKEQNCLGVLNANETDNSNLESECVICMDLKSEVVFVPCGHMCCCQICSENKLENCPMCRSIIERKIKVILVV